VRLQERPDAPTDDDLPLEAGSTPDRSEGGLVRDLVAVVQAALGMLQRAGQSSPAAIAGSVEWPARVLTRRVVAGALASPRPVGNRRTLAKELASRSPSQAIARGATAAMAMRVARRFRPMGALLRKTPAWLVATAGPAIYASSARGAEELTLIASHLAHRARTAGVELDPERVRRVTVQLLTGRPVDPDVEPAHGPLVLLWTRRAVKAALPLTTGARTRDPDRLARAAAEVTVEDLAR